MKKFSLIPLVAAVLLLAACNGNTNTSSSTSDSTNMSTMNNDTNTNHINSTDTTNNNNTAATVGNDEKDFAQDAAAGGMMEVQLGNIAEKNASSQAVKDFGRMMVDDHSKLNDQLKDLAAKKNVTLPTAVKDDQQKHIDKLSKETGTNFDKDYVSMMIDDHKKDIAAFKKAGDKMTDPDFKDFVIKALPTLQKHLDAVQAIHKKM